MGSCCVREEHKANKQTSQQNTKKINQTPIHLKTENFGFTYPGIEFPHSFGLSYPHTGFVGGSGNSRF